MNETATERVNELKSGIPDKIIQQRYVKSQGIEIRNITEPKKETNQDNYTPNNITGACVGDCTTCLRRTGYCPG